ncbi:MAG TPA: sugar porter family MFS transporter [Bacteroidales bacterium]|nr:sugar porter family MFS transporter [Bacteroidales bacterium]
MQEARFNIRFLLGVSLIAAMGGLLFGYDFVVIGGAKPFYEPFFGITGKPVLQGWVMSCALAGCLAGAAFSGRLSDRYGRKKLLLVSAVLFIAASAGTGASSSLGLFIIFRIMGGVGIGIASNISPLYIAEITPAGLRGRFVSVNQLTIVIGILLAQLINWRIADPVPSGYSAADIMNSWNGQEGWRYMFWACGIPALLFFILSWFVPESPRWLARDDKNTGRILSILGRAGGNTYAAEELRSIKATVGGAGYGLSRGWWKGKSLSAILLLGVILAVLQQWCGINVIFNYAQEIFSGAGYGVSDILFNIVITGSVNLLFTFVGMFTVDRLGRKALMLMGSGGLAAIFTIVGMMYFLHVKGIALLVMVVMAIACYSMSLAPVTWVILSELFPNRIRGAAMSVATFALWAACFVLTYTFPILNTFLKASGTFMLYAMISLSGFFYILFRLPETKGKSLELIESELIR